jgi:hypothetical protein
MACLEHATELDPAVRALVEDRGARLIPPRTYEEATNLAAVGPLVLELLPGPEGLDEDEAVAVVWTAGMIGTDAAIPVLARFTSHEDGLVHRNLTSFPPGVESERYASDVLRLLPRADTIYHASTADELDAVAALGNVQHIFGQGQLTATETLARLGNHAIVQTVELNASVDDDDLRMLCALPALLRLGLFSAYRLTDLSPLTGHTLRSLTLYELSAGLDLAPLTGLASLVTLALESDDVGWGGLATLPDGLPVKNLYTSYGANGLQGIERLRGLERISCRILAGPMSPKEWERMATLPDLTSLTVRGVLSGLDPRFTPLPAIRRLSIEAGSDVSPVAAVPELFPRLEEITFFRDVSGKATAVDLAPLAPLPGLRLVRLSGLGPISTLNADALAADVEIRPRPRA